MRPALASKVRLRWDDRAGAMMLLAPERGLILDERAAAIVALCDGKRTIADIAASLAPDYGPCDGIERDVEAFVGELVQRGLAR